MMTKHLLMWTVLLATPIAIGTTPTRAQDQVDARRTIIATKTTLFFNTPVADGPTELKPGQRAPTFVSTVLTLRATIASREPLLLDFSVLADNDRAFSGSLHQADKGRSEPVGVSCLPMLDGQRAGHAVWVPVGRVEPSATEGDVLNQPRHTRVTMPRGEYPDALALGTNRHPGVAAGPHAFALRCEGRAPLRFFGTARLTVMQ
jgi:hypothetical protein